MDGTGLADLGQPKSVVHSKDAGREARVAYSVLVRRDGSDIPVRRDLEFERDVSVQAGLVLPSKTCARLELGPRCVEDTEIDPLRMASGHGNESGRGRNPAVAGRRRLGRLLTAVQGLSPWRAIARAAPAHSGLVGTGLGPSAVPWT